MCHRVGAKEVALDVRKIKSEDFPLDGKTKQKLGGGETLPFTKLLLSYPHHSQKL